jgi:hypothetical protein
MVESPLKYVGIDFSGNQPQWNANASESNVWIAEVEECETHITLVQIQRVQKLPGQDRPFTRLAAWLADESFSAAAIDAPFSIPWWFFGYDFDDHLGLMSVVNEMNLTDKKDFPSGKAFVERVTAGISFPFTKPLRVTESHWGGRGVNTRSTVWAGPRTGAAFTSACIKLMANSHRAIWPWSSPESQPLVEAFPAAQLRHWGLPFVKYNGPDGNVNRTAIIKNLEKNRGLRTNNDFRSIMLNDADALDAVLCCYAARAIVRDHLAVGLPLFDAWRLEGWIAVHD